MLAGITFSLSRGSLAGNLRYLLLVPPLGVAAYFFAVNMFRHYDGSLPDRLAITVRENSFRSRASTGIRLFSRLCMGRSPALLTD